MDFSQPALEKVLKDIDGGWELERAQPLSARVLALQIKLPSQAQKRVMLCWHSQADRARNPHIARDEFRLLRILKRACLPVPPALHLQTQHSPPFFITEAIDAATRFEAEDLPAFCRQLAQTLCQIHSVSRARFDLSFLPSQADIIADCLRAASPETHAIRRAIAAALPALVSNPPVLLHGDYWLGNLLWRGEELAAVIDWEDAALGDPMSDLGKSRLEMLWALGQPAMELYTASYCAIQPGINRQHLPFWDFLGALRLRHFAGWFDEPAKIAKMRAQYERFTADAIRALQALQK